MVCLTNIQQLLHQVKEQADKNVNNAEDECYWVDDSKTFEAKQEFDKRNGNVLLHRLIRDYASSSSIKNGNPGRAYFYHTGSLPFGLNSIESQGSADSNDSPASRKGFRYGRSVEGSLIKNIF
ncbi:hypothetical protein HELRODRAFT_168212 [Helobdella robusta]|uniref:Uncharacterized protein n=1 Tax=Helobdella robusta TaxID=6412 RepID=T1F0B3_HELRO|nr:hypothetical protein HELRODRAFT_168212 [Helobdella robusta]ESO09250.1 hypothetical protein HELRODRAFT_168212 [Helobdella robusta]